MARILVVEDDSHMRRTLTSVLEEEEHVVTGAGSGPEALAVARRQVFDLVVTDIRMEGMDGLECLAALRELKPDLRSIVITGYASDEAPVRAMAVRAEDYLYKPFRLQDLLTSVERVMGASSDREGHHKLLSSVVGGFKKLLDTLSRGGRAAEELEESRHLVFQSFFVGIRSGKLKPAEALRAWDRLEKLETEREQLRSEGCSPSTWQELLVGYNYLVDLLGALASQRLRPEPRQGSLDEALFNRLYERVQKGQLSCEELKLAPYLRTLEPEVLRSSPMLGGLHAKLWGQG